ncbi:MAG: single-stranded DNA-binding protein [Clostridia bacterium]
MNKVILTGNLTRDPELSTVSSGISVCKFGIAVQRKFKKPDGDYEVDFFNVTAWRSTAEFCNTYLKKGSKIGIVGTIQTRTYEQDGVKKYATDIIADEVEFLTSKSDSGNTGSAGGNYGNKEQKPQRVKASVEKMQPMEDDDLPF